MTKTVDDQLTWRSWVRSSLSIVFSECLSVFFDSRNDGSGHLSKKRSGDNGEIGKHGKSLGSGVRNDRCSILVEVVEHLGVLGELVKTGRSHSLREIVWLEHAGKSGQESW